MYPRRYFSQNGLTVLIGLSAEETAEFERLDAVSPLGSDGDKSDRLVALYTRHQFAYETMLATSLSD